MGELPGAPDCILKVCTETMNRSNGVVAQIMLLLPQGVHILIPRCVNVALQAGRSLQMQFPGGEIVLYYPSGSLKRQGKREAGDWTSDRGKKAV